MPLDTVRIRFEQPPFKTLNLENWSKRTNAVNPEELFIPAIKHEINLRKYDSDVQACGIHAVVEADGRTFLEFSAKTLGSDYLNGLSQNNIEKAFYNIDKISDFFFTLDAEKVMQGTISKVHNTINLEYEQKDLIPLVTSLKNCISWKHKKTDNRFLTTADFKNKSEGLQIYAKKQELQLHDKNYFKLCADKIKGEFARVEHKLDSAIKVISVYGKAGIRNTRFTDVLENKNSGKVLRHTFNNLTILDDVKKISYNPVLFEMLSNPDIPIDYLKKRFGSAGIYEQLNYSQEALREALKMKYKDKGLISRVFKTILIEYNDALKIQEGSNIDYKAYTNEFKEKAYHIINELEAVG